MISRDFFSVANNLGDSVAFNSEFDRRLLVRMMKWFTARAWYRNNFMRQHAAGFSGLASETGQAEAASHYAITAIPRKGE